MSRIVLEWLISNRISLLEQAAGESDSIHPEQIMKVTHTGRQ